ncbi:MAG TPA: hypothetical protein VEU51_09185, partial [Candidatus Acidoferrales bacterium]|nr:hypothetical protein [Candidatus Acidoferrales bacterium]
MNESKRGTVLTAISVLLVLLAIEDILKPFHLEGPTTGLVFFGTRLSGVKDAIIAPLFGLFLLFYASTIWRMRLMALTVAYGYAVYVVINLVLFTVRNPPPTERGDQI